MNIKCEFGVYKWQKVLNALSQGIEININGHTIAMDLDTCEIYFVTTNYQTDEKVYISSHLTWNQFVHMCSSLDNREVLRIDTGLSKS